LKEFASMINDASAKEHAARAESPTPPDVRHAATYPRPLAAFRLGYNPFAFRIFTRLYRQCPLFWECAAIEGPQDGLELAIERLWQARIELASCIPINVFNELSRVLEGLRRFTESLIGSVEETGADRENSRGSVYAPGTDLGWELCRLADQALDGGTELRAWFDLGAAIGRHQLRLSEGGTEETGDEDPSPARGGLTEEEDLTIIDYRELAVSAAALPEQHIRSLPELGALAALASQPGRLTSERSLAEALRSDLVPGMMVAGMLIFSLKVDAYLSRLTRAAEERATSSGKKDWRNSIRVDVANSTIELKDKTYPLEDRALVAFVDILVKAEGRAVPLVEMTNVPGLKGKTNVTRLRDKLPPAIREVILSKRGSGSRLLVEKLT
jgi:hypothetical protein